MNAVLVGPSYESYSNNAFFFELDSYKVPLIHYLKQERKNKKGRVEPERGIQSLARSSSRQWSRAGDSHAMRKRSNSFTISNSIWYTLLDTYLNLVQFRIRVFLGNRFFL